MSGKSMDEGKMYTIDFGKSTNVAGGGVCFVHMFTCILTETFSTHNVNIIG